MNRRFRELAKDVRTSFTVGALTINEPAAPGQFDRPTLTERAQAFQQWLEAQIGAIILEIGLRVPGALRIRQHWQESFIRAAYMRGIAAAEAELSALGLLSAPLASIEVAFRTGVHAETLALMNARVFEGLRGITQDMASKLSEIFSRSLIEGVGPRSIAKRITDEIASISRKRAMVMARTETIRVFNEAALNTMEQNGIVGVTAEVELLTAMDSRVCQICRSLSGKVYTIQQARGVIPVHPRCRCCWISAQKAEQRAA